MNKFTVTIQRKDQSLTREVNKDSFTIGRSTECDISLNETLISRVHLVVSRRWNQIWVEDKNSSNGTFINGTKIVQGSPVNLVASDKIRLGKAEYILAIDLEVEEVTEEPLPPMSEESVAALVEETIAMPPPQFVGEFQAEKVLHEAKRRAAQIILDGETQAEKRVQVIYQKARESQAQAEHFYQTRLSEAHKEADAILADFQKQGRDLLQSARQMSQELREEVDVYVEALREKARQDAEHVVAEATLSSERIKTEALSRAQEAAQTQAETLLAEARDEASRIVEFTRLKGQEVQEKLDHDQQELTRVERDLATAQADLLQAQATLAEAKKEDASIREHLLHHCEIEEKRLKDLVYEQQSTVQELQNKIKDAEDEKIVLEKNLKAMQERQASLSLEIQDLEGRKNHLFKEYESQKVFLNEKLENEKSQMAKSEEQRLEEMRLETAKRLKKMEHDLLEDLVRRKENILRDMREVLEKEIVQRTSVAQWKEMAESVEAKMVEALDGKLAELSQSAVLQHKAVDVTKKRKKEKVHWSLVGAVAGAVIFFVAQIVVQQVSSDNAPMQSLVKREAQKRQEDLEKRKFAPAQAEDLKDSYTDSVLYTRNYSDIYSDQVFQEKLYRGVSQYLLKTWRLDEDKSIQALAASRALVKELTEKRAQIHPDFIKEGIAKMRETEGATLARLKGILGTEVRVESYRRFERNFYREETQRRRLAGH